MSCPANQRTMSFSCRECGAEVSIDAQRCPACGCQTPFQCVECHRPLGSVSLNVRSSQKHPHGAFSPEGEPLCSDHRLTRCHQCTKYFPLQEMKRREVGIHADTNLRPGMKPRLEKVYAHFCPECYAGRRKPQTAASSPWSVILGLVAAVAVVILLALAAILFSRH